MTMRYIRFELTGDMAMWRNPYEPVGSYSCLGPSPSQIAGLLGAALGFAAPRSAAAKLSPKDKTLKATHKIGLPWPVSSELLRWQEDNDYAVACRWLGAIPHRIQWNINGFKSVKDLKSNLRLQQQVVDQPKYEVLIRIANLSVAERVVEALHNPAFPVCLGASFCRAIIKHVGLLETVPQVAGGNDWAYHKACLPIGEAAPFSCHVINPEQTGERIVADGYWVYPTPLHHSPKSESSDPCIRGYRKLDVQDSVE